MNLPLPPVNQSLLRWSLLFGGVARVCQPRTEAGATLLKEPGADEAFFYRNKLGKALTFVGTDYQRVLAIEQSADRCQPIGLLLESRANMYAPWEFEEQFTFSCNEVKWSPAKCEATVTPTTDDGYRLLLENYDTEYNLLASPATRTTVSGQLVDLAAGISIEFRRVGRDEQTDYLGVDGWVLFLTNTSWIESSGSGGTRESNNIIFRYRLRNVPMTKSTDAQGQDIYTPVDKSAGGWEILYSNPYNPNATTIDYVKEPAIAGFKAYKIGTYNDWNDPRNPFRYSRWGDQLLLVGGGELPSTYGFSDAAYVEVTGREGFGAYSEECRLPGDPDPSFLAVRKEVGEDNCARIFWRFGDFRFTRAFPLLSGVHWLLSQTVAATGQASLLPPLPGLLSSFYTLDPNPATGTSGAANELPRLMLSAASDVKRYGASEPATRLLVSLKQMLNDLSALHDVGWFIDPATGWLRIEHRSYEETQHGAGVVVDLTAIDQVQFPGEYSYRTQVLPRYDELTVTSASTEDLAANVFFADASIDYGTSACVNNREGQNKSTRTSARLTGDVTAAVLNGNAIPDEAIVLLTRGADARIEDANRALSASRLLLNYHGYGAAFGAGTVAGQALVVQSVKPSRQEEGISVPFCSLRTLDGSTRFTTDLGPGGKLGKAELDLRSGATKLTVWPPLPSYTTPAPALTSRDFSDDFSQGLS
ncbi:MAG: hypothetical protein ACRYFZ_09510 [Janthinobacterium lividum]